MTGDGDDGQAGVVVTEADRATAWLVLSALPISIPGYSPETVRKAQDHLAAALAAERAKAREPFLALADELKGRGWSASDSSMADRIRRAAEDGQ